ncbi:carbonic anhydrase, partial [Embleya sp. NPDC056538]
MTDPQAPTPREAFELVLAGNQRFVSGSPEHPNQDAARRAETAPSQQPFAVLFGCSDSRLAAEIIFDRGLGDLFVVRTAGHVVGAEV